MATKQKQIVTSGLEKQLLKEYVKTSPLVLLRFKAQAVLLAASGGTPELIAVDVDRTPRTVILWLRDWRNRRLASIFTSHKDNRNAGKLTLDQLEEIRQVLQSPPSDFGLPREFWEVPQLKQYIAANFGVVYESERSYRYILEFSNLSFKYADTFDRKRDVVLIEERMNAITAELAPLLSNDDWEVFAVDEVKVQQEAVIRRAWLQKGVRTIVKVNRDKESQSYIGFLNQETFDCELHEMPWQNSEEVLKAMKLFLENHPNKKIAIVWDNAPFHKSKAIREALTRGGLLERVHLIAMPPYAPDNNPIEHVWNTAKQHISNIQHETFEETKQAFSDFVALRLFRYSFRI
jgi:transposase